MINVRYFTMAIVSLLFISDTFVNEAHPLNKFELFNTINPTLSILVSLLLVSTRFMNHVLKVTTALHSSVSLGFFF